VRAAARFADCRFRRVAAQRVLAGRRSNVKSEYAVITVSSCLKSCATRRQLRGSIFLYCRAGVSSLRCVTSSTNHLAPSCRIRERTRRDFDST